MLTKSEFKKELELLKELFERIEKTQYTLFTLFGETDGLVAEETYELQDTVINYLDKLCPDPKNGWVSWFIFDNSWGQMNHTVVDPDQIGWVVSDIDDFCNMLYGMGDS